MKKLHQWYLFYQDSTVRTTLMPYWYEAATFIMYAGLLLSQLTNPENKGGLGWFKYLVVLLVRSIYQFSSFHKR